MNHVPQQRQVRARPAHSIQINGFDLQHTAGSPWSNVLQRCSILCWHPKYSHGMSKVRFNAFRGCLYCVALPPHSLLPGVTFIFWKDNHFKSLGTAENNWSFFSSFFFSFFSLWIIKLHFIHSLSKNRWQKMNPQTPRIKEGLFLQRCLNYTRFKNRAPEPAKRRQ